MKYLNYSIFILCTLFWSQLSFGQKLSVEVFNKTGADIDSLFFADQYFGPIKQDSSLIISNLEELVFSGGGVPLERPSAIIFGAKSETAPKDCSTKSIKKTSGSYQFDLHSYPSENGFRLYWIKHE